MHISKRKLPIFYGISNIIPLPKELSTCVGRVTSKVTQSQNLISYLESWLFHYFFGFSTLTCENPKGNYLAVGPSLFPAMPINICWQNTLLYVLKRKGTWGKKENVEEVPIKDQDTKQKKNQ